MNIHQHDSIWIFWIIYFIGMVQLAMAADGIPDVYKTDNGLFVVTEQQNRVQMQELKHPLNLVIPKLNQEFYQKWVTLLDRRLTNGVQYTQHGDAWTNQTQSLLAIPYQCENQPNQFNCAYLFWTDKNDQNMYQTNLLYLGQLPTELPKTLLDGLKQKSAIRLDAVQQDWFVLEQNTAQLFWFKKTDGHYQQYHIKSFPAEDLHSANSLYLALLNELQADNRLYQCQQVWFSYNHRQLKIWQPVPKQFTLIEFPPKILALAKPQFLTTLGINTTAVHQIQHCKNITDIAKQFLTNYAQQSKNHQVQILALSTGGYVIYNPENGDLFSYLKGFERWYGKAEHPLNEFMKVTCTFELKICQDWTNKNELELLKRLAPYAVLGRHGSGTLAHLQWQRDLGIKRRSPAWLFIPSK